MCTMDGTTPWKEILQQHLESEMHKKAVEAEKKKKVKKTQLSCAINKLNAQLKNRLAGLMIDVFNDGKKVHSFCL